MQMKKAGNIANVEMSTSIKETIMKALIRKSEWTDKDELLDVVYWGRQIFSFLIGICWGCFPIKGIIGLFLYVIASTLIGHFYLTWFQGKDDEDFGGFWEIAKEGFGAAFATFLVSWILIYSAKHFD